MKSRNQIFLNGKKNQKESIKKIPPISRLGELKLYLFNINYGFSNRQPTSIDGASSSRPC